MKGNKKVIISICIIVLLVVLAIVGIFIAKTWNNNNKEGNTVNEMDEFKSNSIMYDEEASLNELKEEYKITGPDEIYEIQTEYDGRRAIVVKPEIDYKVAFAGIIKNDIPSFEEIDTIYNENYPQQNGVWIDEDNRETIVNYLNNTELLNNEYSVNENGFLQVNVNKNETEMDKTIEKEIDSNKLTIISISGTCYMVNPATGEITRNPFEDLNRTQTYEYFEYENDKIIFVTENVNKELTEDEILESIIELVKY